MGGNQPTVTVATLADMTEDQLGIALANLRQAIRGAKGDELKELQTRRKLINARLNKFVLLHLEKIDKDPAVQAITAELAALTLQVQATVREMRSAKAAIEKATVIIGHADKFLSLIKSAVPGL